MISTSFWKSVAIFFLPENQALIHNPDYALTDGEKMFAPPENIKIPERIQYESLILGSPAKFFCIDHNYWKVSNECKNPSLDVPGSPSPIDQDTD